MVAGFKAARRVMSAGLASGLALAAASHSQALTITPFFDSTVTGASNSAQIEAAIDEVTGFYARFSNPVNVKILFRLGDIGGPGGQSLTTLYLANHDDFVEGLTAQAAAHPENAVLNLAVSNLAWGNSALSTGRPDIEGTSANFRALGAPTPGAYDLDGNFGSGDIDGIVTLDSGPADEYSFTHSVGPTQHSGTDVLFHEVDEVLGVGGYGSSLSPDDPLPTALGVEDLYRYADYHSPSYTTDPSAFSYFSIDGGEHAWEFFNQGPNGDYGDWARFACNDGLHAVQEWAGCSGEPFVGLNDLSPEVTALQAIGYNLGVPEPGLWALMIAGFGLAGTTLRRRLAV